MHSQWVESMSQDQGVECSQGTGCEYRSWLGLGPLSCVRLDVSHQGKVQEVFHAKQLSVKAKSHVYQFKGCGQLNTALWGRGNG